MPPKHKAAHHTGSYQQTARRVVAAANRNPTTRCRRCGHTLAEHPPHKNGKRPWWTAGHVIDGQVGGTLLPEASTCNYSAGATAGNLRRNQPRIVTTRTW